MIIPPTSYGYCLAQQKKTFTVSEMRLEYNPNVTADSKKERLSSKHPLNLKNPVLLLVVLFRRLKH